MDEQRTPPEGPDLLTEPLFTVHEAGKSTQLSLPALIAHLLTQSALEGFPQLAAQQRGYWWRFLVRCATRALRSLNIDVDAAESRATVDVAAAIKAALRDAAAVDGAWLLYQPAPDRPGFLQAPTFDGAPPDASGYKAATMSHLSGALGAKNHERKVDLGRLLDPEQTVYALVEHQSGVVFGGRGHYESQLMGSRSGAGSGTPFMGAWLGDKPAETFRHDVRVFLERWETVRTTHGLRGDLWALWTERWDGETSLSPSRLDPAFIPIARLLRLDPIEPHGRFHRVRYKTTGCSRVQDHLSGNLGDPFTPLVENPNADGLKVRGTLAKGYDYTEVVRLLLGEDAVPSPSVLALRDARPDERDDVFVVFEGVAYEQGKTAGFHRRVVPLPLSRLQFLLSNPAPARKAHERMLQVARKTKTALRGAARILLAGHPKPREGDRGKVEPVAAELEAEIDRVYIPALLDAARRQTEGDPGYEADWAARLSELARDVFRRQMAAIPTSSGRRYEREIRAEAWLQGRLRRLRGEPADEEGQAQAVHPPTPTHEEVKT